MLWILYGEIGFQIFFSLVYFTVYLLVFRIYFVEIESINWIIIVMMFFNNIIYR